MRGRGFAAVGILLALFLVSGCGEDSATGEGATGLSKAAFIRKADAICQQAQTEIARKNIAQIRKLASDPKAREKLEYKLVETSLVPVLEGEVAQLQALGTPPGDAAQIAQMLKLIEGAVAEAKSGTADLCRRR